ncbi:hypothetical protein ZHAS_00006836 [Anopheles sinensis]|uniref:Uncharacterized protein n=1 Tax=Anopheles sinensis TaxID=74873 RepID=A0A084VN67_ANOSI|nr:hypothetical protein ZHAS_00006836 [Anopheles sinensis]
MPPVRSLLCRRPLPPQGVVEKLFLSSGVEKMGEKNLPVGSSRERGKTKMEDRFGVIIQCRSKSTPKSRLLGRVPEQEYGTILHRQQLEHHPMHLDYG